MSLDSRRQLGDGHVLEHHWWGQGKPLRGGLGSPFDGDDAVTAEREEVVLRIDASDLEQLLKQGDQNL